MKATYLQSAHECVSNPNCVFSVCSNLERNVQIFVHKDVSLCSKILVCAWTCQYGKGASTYEVDNSEPDREARTLMAKESRRGRILVTVENPFGQKVRLHELP